MNSFELRDKVKLKSSGLRGIVEGFAGGKIIIRADGVARLMRLAPSKVTNFSLAARKAWLSMPKRQVGRPKGLRLCDRVSVTLRIDRELWEEFRGKENSGVIRDRTETVNCWLREKLACVNVKEEA